MFRCCIDGARRQEYSHLYVNGSFKLFVLNSRLYIAKLLYCSIERVRMNNIFPNFLVLIQMDIVQISIRLEIIRVWYIRFFTHFCNNGKASNVSNILKPKKRRRLLFIQWQQVKKIWLPSGLSLYIFHPIFE
jgi:hypothetical protein